MKKLPVLLFILFVGNLIAQEPMRVVRCKAVDGRSPVSNIYVDEENNKWVSNSKGVFEVHDLDLATQVSLSGDEQSLYSFANGNSNLKWSAAELNAKIGGVLDATNKISTGYYNAQNDNLWIGTTGSGIFQLKTKPELKLIEQFTSRNSKLKSDYINTIFKDKTGQYWIGTEEGVLVGKDGKFRLIEKYFNIRTIIESGRHIWVMGDDLIWKTDTRADFTPIHIEEEMIEGEIKDIAADSKGRLWIVSEVVTLYNREEDHFHVFGPADYFTSQFATCIAVDLEDAVWVGTKDKGLYLIEKESAMTVTCLVDKALSCDPGSTDAALKVRVTGGQPPYEYRWEGGQKGETLADLGPGTYIVTVTDDKGKTKQEQIEIPDPSVQVSIVQDSEESAEGAGDAAATITVTGGTPGYIYLWDNGETTQTAISLNEGVHSVTVTDKNGCNSSASVNINRKIGELGLALEQTTANQCPGDKNAALQVKVSGGKAPFQFNWGMDGLTGELVQGLAAGTYGVTVIDATGTEVSSSFQVEAPEELQVSLTVEAPASTNNSDGVAQAQVTGGTGTYQFQWDNGETVQQASELAPGTHTLVVTDASGCTATASIDILENILPLSANLTATANINCPGALTGALNVDVKGGKEPYQYQWNKEGLTGESAANLAAGTYSITVIDSEGTSVSSEFAINEPDALVANIEVEASASTDNSDGVAMVKANGGSGNYTYQWDNGESTEKASQLAPGNRIVTVTDEGGCSTTATITITEDILPLSVSIGVVAELKCFGEKTAQIDATVKGGKGPFQYKWNTDAINGPTASGLGAGNYEVTITDVQGTESSTVISITEPEELTANILVEAPASTDNADGKATIKPTGGTGEYSYQWDNGENTVMASKLAPGTHAVTITDQSGCTATTSIEITENILPLAIILTETQSVNCAGEQSAALVAEVSGGKKPFQLQWSDSSLSGENVSGLAAGTYEVTVTDAVGTEMSTNIQVNQPEPLTLSVKADAPASTGNSDGQATALITGGKGNYTFQWDDGEASQTAKQLAPGSHTVTVTDESGCSATATIEITENILPLALNLSQSSEIKCQGDQTGALALDISGGKQPYSFSWNIPSLSGDSPNKLAAGDYEVTITDASGQSVSKKLSIKEPAALSTTIIKSRPATHEKSNDGVASLRAEGGTGNYTYKWDNGESKIEAEELPLGTHQVTVTDENGCEATASVDIAKKIIPALTAGQLRSGQRVKMEQLQFDADSTDISKESVPVLDELFLFLEDNPTIIVEIGGHTNNIPPHSYCDELSTSRAKSVADYITQKGIDPRRVYYKGYGKRDPVATNLTPEGRQKNQRVEVKILKLGNN